jgi:hypothetical protein
MMKKLFLVLLFSPFSLFAQISNLSENTSISINPHIISNDTVTYVLWDDQNDGDYDLFFRKYSAGTWSTVKQINTPYIKHLSSVCMGDSGTVYVLWSEQTNNAQRLMYGRIVDTVLIDSTEIFQEDSSTLYFSSCLFDRTTSNLHISWDIHTGDSFYTYYSVKEKNKQWTDKQIINTRQFYYIQPRAQLVKDKNNDIVCLWCCWDSMSIEMKRKSDTIWIPGTSLTYPGGGIGRNFVAHNDDSLNIHIVSLPIQVMTCPCNSLVYAKWDGTQWSIPEVVPTRTYYNPYTMHQSPDISMSAQNYPVITWQQDDYDNNLSHVSSCIGTSVKTKTGWNMNASIWGILTAENPMIRVSQDGYIHYVWQDAADGDYDVYSFKTALLTSIQTEKGLLLPKKTTLHQNHPNPFNPSTTLSFDLPKQSFVMLKVYDVVGHEIATLVNEPLPAGTHSAFWNASTVSSGVYFYTLQTDSYSETKRLVLVK